MNRVIVAGGRDFSDYDLLRSKLDRILSGLNGGIEVVSGTANGADRLGERYAKERGYPIRQFPADWDRFKKKAGYIRNKQMAEYGTHCVCFWDGKSPGTKMMISLAKEKGLAVRVVGYT